MNFDEYLLSKKIAVDRFKKAEPAEYDRLLLIFEQVHPDSFTAQKLFLINPLRRKYLLEVKKIAEVTPEATSAPKPNRPRPTFNKPKI